MVKRSKAPPEAAERTETLKGWRQIAQFLGEPVSVVKRWKTEGMPVTEQGRFVSSSSEALTEWLRQQSGKPVSVVTPETDLGSELKRAVDFARRRSRSNREEK
jgi:hypothetical protein